MKESENQMKKADEIRGNVVSIKKNKSPQIKIRKNTIEHLINSSITERSKYKVIIFKFRNITSLF